jgi:predicted NBD/HSP70 family sugar kinase
MMLGVELLDARVVAVSVDDGGHVVARASADAAGNVGRAARAALDTVRLSASAGAALGVASPSPESESVAAALATLGGDYTGVFTVTGAMASGTAAALAEAWVGAGRGINDIAYFAVAEHTTGGIVRGGVPVVGSHSRAAALGWLALNPVEREDYRKIGCLEAEVAAAGIVRRLVWRIKSGDRSHVQDVVSEDLSAITVQHVLDGARERDGVCVSVVRDTAKYLGMAAANVVAVSDPEMLILGGIMASAADLLLDLVRTEIARRLPRTVLDALTIVPAALGEEAPAIGAARLAAAALR